MTTSVNESTKSWLCMTQDNRPKMREIITEVMHEHGIEGQCAGDMEFCDLIAKYAGLNSLNSPNLFIFKDAKQRFIYELKGGDKYFDNIIFERYTSQWKRKSARIK